MELPGDGHQARQQAREITAALFREAIRRTHGVKRFSERMRELGVGGRFGGPTPSGSTFQNWQKVDQGFPTADLLILVIRDTGIRADDIIWGDGLQQRMGALEGELRQFLDRLDWLTQSVLYLGSALGVELGDREEVPETPTGPTLHEMVIELREMRRRLLELGGA